MVSSLLLVAMYIELLGFALLTATVSFLEDNQHGFHLNSSCIEDVFSSSRSLRRIVGDTIAEMKEVENTNLLLGEPGDIKYDLLSETSENYTIHPFGSRLMGLGLRTSDLDVFLDVGNCYGRARDGKTPHDCAGYVEPVADSLRGQNRSFYFLRVIPEATVPLLKVVHRNTGIHVDISTRNGLAVESSHLIRGYMTDQSIKFVCVATKLWARGLGISKPLGGQGAFSSYSMLWLTLFALMNDNPPAVSPVVQIKQAYTGAPLIVDGWDCGHCKSTHPLSKNSKSDIELLHHFFTFYSKMNLSTFQKNVICPYTGTLIPRASFANTNSLPSEFGIYKELERANSSAHHLICKASLCIQDPVEQRNDNGKKVEDWAILRFLEFCTRMAKIMKKSGILDQSIR